jgi:hypothetical protein
MCLFSLINRLEIVRKWARIRIIGSNLIGVTGTKK